MGLRCLRVVSVVESNRKPFRSKNGLYKKREKETRMHTGDKRQTNKMNEPFALLAAVNTQRNYRFSLNSTTTMAACVCGVWTLDSARIVFVFSLFFFDLCLIRFDRVKEHEREGEGERKKYCPQQKHINYNNIAIKINTAVDKRNYCGFWIRASSNGKKVDATYTRTKRRRWKKHTQR